ncbi:hypothetical protein JCM9279_003815 [Rhodotorula babjevae]
MALEAARLACDPCRRLFADTRALLKHRLVAACRPLSTTIPVIPTNSTLCATCVTPIPNSTWAAHLRSSRHAEAVAYQQYKAREEDEDSSSTRKTVKISPQQTVDFGHVEFDPSGGNNAPDTVTRPVDLAAASGFVLFKAVFLSSTQTSDLGVKRFTTQNFENKPLVVGLDGKARFFVHFHPRNSVGVFVDSILLYFRHPDGDAAIMHQRALRGTVGSAAHLEQYSAREQYTPASRRIYRPRPNRQDVVAAPKIENDGPTSVVQWVVKPPPLLIPYKMRQLLVQGSLGAQINDFKHLYIPEFELGSYGEYWRRLIQAEHVQEEIEVQNYDRKDATLFQSAFGRPYYLDVPGLAEKRPSVLPGDRVRVQIHGAKACGALADDPARPELIFPTEHTVYPGPPTAAQAKTHKFLDAKIADNPNQRQAVLSIFYGSSGPAPFVLYGPPGTGKTTTLREAVNQLVTYRDDTKLLLAAPFNAAADVLCGTLDLPTSSVLRLNAMSRRLVDVAKNVVRFCVMSEDDSTKFACPELEEINKYRVVVVTCMSASMLTRVGVKKGHFTHIIIDEAGQATEPQTYVPMSLADEKTSVILAGDPKQLGPVVHSSVAVAVGLQKSLLERLMDLPDYAEHNLDRRGVTYVKLLQNYRSHPAVLTVPNELFYGNELVAMADPATQNKLLGWHGWPSGDFPIIFHNVKGEDEREGNCPSYFNCAELTVVDSYVMRLLDRDSGAGLEEKDIGVIAPYSGQVKKLTSVLARPHMTVGSCEQFQGQERSLIIISTTRSNRNYLDQDALFSLGFLSSPKRFNVAITRAASGLIVVGNADTLSVDPLWRRFLLHVHDHSSWLGEPWDADAARKADFDPSKAALEELNNLMAKLDELEVESEDEQAEEEGW